VVYVVTACIEGSSSSRAIVRYLRVLLLLLLWLLCLFKPACAGVHAIVVS
jgi:hypothetical protein